MFEKVDMPKDSKIFVNIDKDKWLKAIIEWNDHDIISCKWHNCENCKVKNLCECLSEMLDKI